MGDGKIWCWVHFQSFSGNITMTKYCSKETESTITICLKAILQLYFLKEYIMHSYSSAQIEIDQIIVRITEKMRSSHWDRNVLARSLSLSTLKLAVAAMWFSLFLLFILIGHNTVLLQHRFPTRQCLLWFDCLPTFLQMYSLADNFNFTSLLL